MGKDQIEKLIMPIKLCEKQKHMGEGKSTLIKYGVASISGSTIEYYDFILAGLAAALIWPTIYYPEVSSALGLLYSILTFALGIAVRPLGAYIFGFVGDRMGRKTSTVWSLIMMGLGSLAVSLTPGYTTLGIIGGLLLFIWRIAQGIAIGGTWGGFAVWVIEHAKDSKWRAFWTNFTSLGVGVGLLSSAGGFLLAITLLSHSALLSWGWRLLFGIGALVALVGIVVRLRLAESPVFNELVAKKEIIKQPTITVLKEQWPRILKLAALFNYQISLFYIAAAFNLGYMIGIGISPYLAFLSTSIAAVMIIIFQTIGSILGDKIGRRRVILIGAILSAAFAFPYYILINTRMAGDVILGQSVFLAVVMFGFGVIGALMPENFPSKYRNSGASLSYQLAAPMSAVASVVPPYFLTVFGGQAWIYIATLMIGICVASLIALAFTAETIRVEVG